MAVEAHALELKLVRDGDGLEVDFRPLQGLWTAPQYLKLTDQTNHLIEFTAGVLEILPAPTVRHQAILEFLYRALFAWVEQHGGEVHVAPLRLRIRKGKYREPDLLLLRDAADPRNQDRFWRGADLVVEVVSPDNPERDTVVKRRDYAEAGIPEYWIVNPLDATVTVLALRGTTYIEQGVFGRGETAGSTVLAAFAVDVAAVFAEPGQTPLTPPIGPVNPLRIGSFAGPIICGRVATDAGRDGPAVGPARIWAAAGAAGSPARAPAMDTERRWRALFTHQSVCPAKAPPNP